MTNLDLDKLEAVAAGGHSYLLQCIEGFADGYFGGSDGKIDASHAEHFAKDLVDSIEWEERTLCLVEVGVLSAVVAELRESRAAVETQRKVADAYREALQDEYRPHIEQNKAFGLVIAAQTEEIEQLRAGRSEFDNRIGVERLNAYTEHQRADRYMEAIDRTRAMVRDHLIGDDRAANELGKSLLRALDGER